MAAKQSDMLSKGTTHGRHALAGFITAQSTPIPISYGGLGMPIPFGGQLWYKAGGPTGSYTVSQGSDYLAAAVFDAAGAM